MSASKPEKRVLTLALKSEYYDEIEAGTKVYEYRLVTQFWMKRLFDKTYDEIVLTRGYPKKSDESRRLTRPWRGCEITRVTHPHFGPDTVDVFAIRVN